MATSTRCGSIRVPPAGHVLQDDINAPGWNEQDGNDRMPGDVRLPAVLLPAGRGGGVWQRAYPGRVEQAGQVRADVRQLLSGCPVADDVVLLMSELAANAVRHSRSGEDGGTFTVRVTEVSGRCVRGEVEDEGSGWHGKLQCSARLASGLNILIALSDACGVSGAGGKRAVWFRLDYPVRS
jgi:hypothetical protein